MAISSLDSALSAGLLVSNAKHFQARDEVAHAQRSKCIGLLHADVVSGGHAGQIDQRHFRSRSARRRRTWRI
jgi:hypothetical protein